MIWTILRHIPQILLAILMVAQTVEDVRQHGRPKRGLHNGYATVGATALCALLLLAGGFWTN